MSTIEQLAATAEEAAVEAHIAQIRQFQTDLRQAAAEYAAMRERAEAAERRESVLREALRMMRSQHFCGCGHPACNRCADIMECDAALAQSQEVGK